jgi:hypothetical protein
MAFVTKNTTFCVEKNCHGICFGENRHFSQKVG